MSDAVTLYSALDDLKQLGVVQWGAKDFCVRATSRAYFKSVSTCDGAIRFSAISSIGCNPRSDYSTTRSCAACRAIYAAEGAPSTPVDRACKLFCTACVVESVNRDAQIHLDASCEPAGGLSAEISESLDKHLEGKAGLIARRYSALTADTLPTAKKSLVSLIESTFTAEVRQELKAGILAFQNLTISRNSESVAVSDLTQSVNLEIVTALLSKTLANVNYVTTVVVPDGGTSITPDDAANQTKSLSALLKQLTTRLVIIGICVLLIIVVGLVAFLIKQRLGA
jgi:hypothetical protein